MTTEENDIGALWSDADVKVRRLPETKSLAPRQPNGGPPVLSDCAFAGLVADARAVCDRVHAVLAGRIPAIEALAKRLLEAKDETLSRAALTAGLVDVLALKKDACEGLTSFQSRQ